MSAAEIIAELPRLSTDERAQVEAKLRELSEPAHAAPQPKSAGTQASRIHSPRLANPEQSSDFVKRIL